MGEFYELRNFMNTWSQQQEKQELHESSANRLYECKPVKSTFLDPMAVFQSSRCLQIHWRELVSHHLKPIQVGSNLSESSTAIEQTRPRVANVTMTRK